MDNLSLADLHQLFVDSGGDADVKFRTKAQAIEAIGELSEDMPPTPEAVESLESDGFSADEDSSSPRRRKAMNWPAKDQIKPHRGGCKRALVVDMLTAEGGATFDEVRDAVNESFPNSGNLWDRKTCYEGIKLIHGHLGYGLRQDPDTGKIEAFVA
jgi:hypothetical protein